MKKVCVFLMMGVLALTLFGCGKEDSASAKKDSTISGGFLSENASGGDSGKQGVFVLANSEYPSWSIFNVAAFTKVNGKLVFDAREGYRGYIEEYWGVDLVLHERSYDACITEYGAGQCDAVCLTNMDVLNPSLGLTSVAILPTSTSYGADACIVPKLVTDVKQLQGQQIFGLEKSVSEYCWARNLELLGQKEKDYKFRNNDPEAAAMNFQQKDDNYTAIVVWNPFVLQTLKKRTDAHVLFDSTTIPGEIIDMVIMSKSALDKPGGDKAACAIIDIYYTMCAMLADKDKQDDTLIALAEKFAPGVTADEMKIVVRQTRFYSTADQGINLFTGGVVFPWAKEVSDTSDLFDGKSVVKGANVTSKTLQDIMPLVVDFCVEHDIIPKKPEIGYGHGASARLVFDPSYMLKVKDKK